MTSSPDERIKTFLEKTASDKRQAEEAVTARNEELTRVMAASHHALNTIKSAVKALESKLSAASASFSVKEADRPDTVATLEIGGRLAGKAVKAGIGVRPDGRIYAYQVGPTFAHIEVHFGNEHQLSVFSATQEDYESLILDLFDVG